MLPNSLNRYKITHLLWCALAKYPCKIRMGRPRHRFPETNWTIEVSFDNMHALSVAVAGLRESMALHGWAATRSIQPGWSIKLPGVRWSILLDVSSPGSPKQISLTILKSCSCEQCQRAEANSRQDQHQVEEQESLLLQKDLVLEPESETPRTDAKAAHKDISGNPYLMSWIDTDFARQLETELRTAQRKLEEANILLEEARDGIKDTLTLLEKADFSHGVTDSSGNDEGNCIAEKYAERLQATVTKISKYQAPSQ